MPDNLYRLLNRYECPSGTGIDERFSTSETNPNTHMSMQLPCELLTYLDQVSFLPLEQLFLGTKRDIIGTPSTP